MSERKPKVSIGLAVYNGEQFLEEALDSILAQTFTDFELIISDNASFDRTAEICREYAARDSRIRYHRNSSNIGGANNENQTVKMAQGKYFRWAADDDICAPTLIEECVKILDQNPSIVLCYSRVKLIDNLGKEIGSPSIGRAESKDAFNRFRSIAKARDNCEQTYGLMRIDVLRETQLQKNYTNSDRTLLAEIALYGEFYEISEYLFFKRMHLRNMYLDWRTRMAWFEPSREGKIVFPWWMQFFDYIRVIGRTPLPLKEKLSCYLFMAEWLLIFGKHLLKDLFVAIYMALHTEDWRIERYDATKNWS
ncbi:MAG: glycosyltransferase family 2 protein [Anaerolineales bacterium]|jgi:glycosyltransferase involved in cell wall biosynthesis